MRRGMRWVLLTVATGMLVAMGPAVSDSTEPSPTVEAINVPPYGHAWSPTGVAVGTGGSIAISNSTPVPHGVHWVGGPATPGCSAGVPVGTTSASSGAAWSGTCTFAQSGTYTFYCTVHGAEMTETVTVTTPGAPTLSTGEASGVGLAEATLHGTVNPQGKATTYHFDYGTTTGYGLKTVDESAGEAGANKPVSTAIASLTPGTTYHYRLVAENTAGTTEGVDHTFKTLTPPGAPSANTGSASALGETGATLNGTVNPNGEATTFFFEWGTSSSYGQSTAELPVAGEDHASHAEAAPVTGLAAGTVYHFRVVAKNASGTVPGLDQTFTTTSPPPPEETKTTPTTTTPAPAPAGPSTATSTTAVVPPAPGPSIVGGPSLHPVQHGGLVKGSLVVSPIGAGGRLEVDIFASGASVTRAKRSASVLVGRVVRQSVPAGAVSFSVKLNARARSALKRRHSLAVSVRITFTPRNGQPVSLTRRLILR